MSKSFCASALAMIVSLAVSLLAAEYILRQYYPVNVGHSLEHRIPHPVFGWVLEPDAEFVHYMPNEGKVEVKYNSRGWRDVEHDIDNPNAVYRVLVLGDSYMEAYSVSLEDAFHRHLGRLADADGVNIEVINLGVGGMGTLQELLLFQEIGVRYKPDLVLLGMYLGNDLRNNSFELESILGSNYQKSNTRPFLISTSDSGWEIMRVDYEGAKKRFEAAKAREVPLSQTIISRSALLTALVPAIRRVHWKLTSANSAPVPVAESSTATGITQKDQMETATLEAEKALLQKRQRQIATLGPNYCEEPAQITRAWDTTRSILGRLKTEVESVGAGLVVFTVPSITDVHPDISGEIEDPELLCLDDPPSHHRAINVLHSLDIERLNLLPVFRDAINGKNVALFRRNDRHWNEAGHEIAASAVYESLKSSSSLSFPAGAAMAN
ncbi:MAG: hypothetical protein AB8C02_12750 [Halioglobus sp.]